MVVHQRTKPVTKRTKKVLAHIEKPLSTVDLKIVTENGIIVVNIASFKF
jgi:hypothetical protein